MQRSPAAPRLMQKQQPAKQRGQSASLPIQIYVLPAQPHFIRSTRVTNRALRCFDRALPPLSHPAHLDSVCIRSVASTTDHTPLNDLSVIEQEMEDLRQLMASDDTSQAKRYSLQRQLLRLRAQQKRMATEIQELERNKHEVSDLRATIVNVERSASG